MNADQITALRACPLLLFISDKMPNAKIPDGLEIFDHAHAVLGSIALV
jgi:hypothetical protein